MSTKIRSGYAICTQTGEEVAFHEETDHTCTLHVMDCNGTLVKAHLTFEELETLMQLRYRINISDPSVEQCEHCSHTWRRGNQSEHYKSCKVFKDALYPNLIMTTVDGTVTNPFPNKDYIHKDDVPF